jgi:NAD-dependent deacetylase
MISQQVRAALAAFAGSSKHLTILTGAGISAESGVPTFRGQEGYWTVGSHNYHPQEMATYAMFRQLPDQVWAWYLYRRAICRRAEPNAGHLALVALERQFGDRFTLITQNVDGLHLRAGNSLARTFQIHGNVDTMRCAEACTVEIYPIPNEIGPVEKGDALSQAASALLRCPHCAGWARPHVLWFDEYYDEAFYRFQSSLAVAGRTGLLIVVGASGATNLPNQVALRVLSAGGLILDVNPEPNIFSQFAEASGGYFIQGNSGQILPQIAASFAK